jgi:hypothetical protein
MHRPKGLSMPAIILRSSQNVLRSSCDQASVKLLSTCDHLRSSCFFPPLYPRRIAAPPWAMGPAWRDPEGREDGEGRKHLVMPATQITRRVRKYWTKTTESRDLASACLPLCDRSQVVTVTNGVITRLPRLLGPILGPRRRRNAGRDSKINRLSPPWHRFGHAVHRAGRDLRARCCVTFNIL